MMYESSLMYLQDVSQENGSAPSLSRTLSMRGMGDLNGDYSRLR